MKNILFSILFLAAFFNTALAQKAQPYDIFNRFVSSGYMGDIAGIKLVKNFRDTKRPDSMCTKVNFTPGKLGWGGLSWQYPANNWCRFPGKNLSRAGYTKITFWVRGETGTEEVKFHSGQDCGDSYVTDEIIKILPKTWTQLTIDLKGLDLSNINGAFIWAIDAKANPQSGSTITFYLDDVRYE